MSAPGPGAAGPEAPAPSQSAAAGSGGAGAATPDRARQSGSWPAAARRTDTWELQVHPPAGRGRVRMLSVTRGWRRLLALGLAVLAVFVGLGLSLLPWAWREAGSPYPHGAAGAERAQEARRLQALVQRLEELLPRSQDVRFEAQKLVVAYDLAANDPGAAPGPESAAADRIGHGERLVADIERELDRAAAWTVEVERYQAAHPDLVRLTPSIRPLAADSEGFVLTSGFGERRDPFTQGREMHAGIDLAAPEGTPVVATADGIVAFAGSFAAGPGHRWWRFGKLVALSHGEDFLTLYGHCGELLVRAGQRVKRGERIATVGSTGWSVAPHLHYEVRRRTGGELRPLDPRLFVLDQRWGDPDRLLAAAEATLRASGFEALPPGLRQ